jgi:hypothetical protein
MSVYDKVQFLTLAPFLRSEKVNDMKLNIKEIKVRENTSFQESQKKTRVYIWPEGETIFENLSNRKSRPNAEYRKQVMGDVLEHMGLPSNTKIRWSQYAGCSCPCSPGFIIDESYGKSVHVTVTAIE